MHIILQEYYIPEENQVLEHGALAKKKNLQRSDSSETKNVKDDDNNKPLCFKYFWLEIKYSNTEQSELAFRSTCYVSFWNARNGVKLIP